MKTMFSGGALLAAAILLAAPAQAGNGRDIVRGAAIGAGGGLVAGALIPGVSTTEGALVGAGVGGVIGATRQNRNKHRWHRDSRGRSYYVDRRGRRHYGN